MAARIGARVDSGQLVAELGPDAAETLMHASGVAAAYGAQVLALAELVATEAVALSAPVAFLKFTALTLGGYYPLGSRTTTDADVLVPREAVGAVWELLGAGRQLESG